MGKVYLQSVRLAIALVCVSAGLILGAHWFGLIPDSTKITAKSRRQLSEAIAMNAAAHVRKRQFVDLQTTVQTLVDRNDDLLSVGIRNSAGLLQVDSGHHAEIWEQQNAGTAGVDAIAVPITLRRVAWGNVELCFHAPETTIWGALAEHPMVRLLAFFATAGVVAYTLFVAKVLRVFSNTQVVPERVRQALDTLAEGLLVLDEKSRIILANDAFARTVDVAAEHLREMSADTLPWQSDGEDLSSKEHLERLPWKIAIRDTSVQTERMLKLQMDDGSRRIFSVNAAPLGGDGSRRGALATFRDVTHIEEHRTELETMLSLLRSSRDEIEEKNRELEILATQDALTGCLNRRAFFEHFSKQWSLAVASGRPLSCIMIDNDHFKRVNDAYGHATGDEVLRQVARVLQRRHGENGIVCRYGGEEFCVLLPDLDFDAAIEQAELTRIAISEITIPEPVDLKLTASIGVSETRFHAKDPQELINQADVSLYAAKRTGRNCVVPFTPKLAEFEGDLSEHANRKGVEIPYQAAAIQIGYQVERLASAVDEQDADGMRTLAARLGMYARSFNIESIASAAERIEQQVHQEEIEWLGLLKDTNELLDLCRATQTDLLRRSLDHTS